MADQSLDLTAVWDDTVNMLKSHKEALIAIAGVFLFLPAWVFAYFVEPIDLEGVSNQEEQIAIIVEFLNQNWFGIMINGLATSFGTLSIYVMLTHQNIGSIGNALKKAVMIFPVFIIVSIITNILTGLGVFALFIGALYLTGRFSAIGGVVAAESERGILGSIQYGWKLTENVGWKAFLMIFIVAIVGIVLTTVIGLVFGLIFNVIGGTSAQLLTTGLDSALGAILTLVIGTLMIAIYRHLKPQFEGVSD